MSITKRKSEVILKPYTKPYKKTNFDLFQIDLWGKPSFNGEANDQEARFANHTSRDEDIQNSHDSLNDFYQMRRFAFLEQVHGNECLLVDQKTRKKGFFWGKADAAFSCEREIILCVRIADCVPILFFSDHPIFFGVIHAGWRGLKTDILSMTISRARKEMFLSDVSGLRFWVGPHIGFDSYEVGEDVFSLFPSAFSKSSLRNPKADDKRMLDLRGILKDQFEKCQIQESQIIWACEDTYSSGNLYSHRGGDMGRNLAVIYRNQ